MNANKEWDVLSAAWKQQEAPTIDVEALRREVARRGRAMRRTIIGETGLAVLVVVACALIALNADSGDYRRGLMGVLGLLTFLYQAYMLWIRRSQWSETGLDGGALLDLEIRRCATTLHYWRFGMWSVLALWLGLYAYWLWCLADGCPPEQGESLRGLVLLYVIVIPLVGVYGAWRSHGVRARRRRLLALQEQARAP
ncbi:hypothetical protein [Arenimonas sp.]|uniref:hypothetical protein n=1 Tax=Arenimonas sp. TaxID=1872635 RepID=UPI0035B078D1